MFPETVITQDNDYSFLPRVISNRTPILNVNDLTNDQLLEEVYTLSPDLIVCAGYNKILSPAILGIPKLGSLNCHAGHLPNYRGASPIPWQIINGETLSVISTREPITPLGNEVADKPSFVGRAPVPPL